MIRVANLTKRYGSTVAVRDISFSAEVGEVIGFLGPNGAGKTTTMRILSCFQPPTQGRVTIAGLDIVRDSLEIRRRVGYLPESVALYPEMRVKEYLDFRAKLRGLSGKKRKSRVKEVLKLCGIDDVSRFVISRLSKGYKQRVGIADCLVHDPDLLILDEPTIGLDPHQIRHVRELIRSLALRHTILLSTHRLSEVEMVCDRVLIMNAGRIVASDTPERLVGLLKGNVHVVAEIKGPRDAVLAGCEALNGVLAVSAETVGEWIRLTLECEKGAEIREDLFRLVTAQKWALRELRSGQKRSLEDAFLAMTDGGNKQ
jgi:ABC-2 type transport system ATP-binding protein